MKKCTLLKLTAPHILALILFQVCIEIALFPPQAGAKGIKTSYKRYSIYKYKNEEVLCEPYVVNKDDWLYKIFRKKGEISEKDFPYFLLIFKELNPQISNIDAIEPKNTIVIPLKKVKKEDYDLGKSDNVDVPVIEFSSLGIDKDIAPFKKKHTVEYGDSISKLIDKEFLQKDGSLSDEGLKAFQLANPNVKNINIIYQGTDIFLPDPAIKSQPWFRSFFSKKSKSPRAIKDKDLLRKKTPPPMSRVDAMTLLQLKKYSSLIGSTLMSQGKMYFPDDEGQTQVIDLSLTPIIENDDGSKIMVITGQNKNDQLLEQVQKYWKDLKIQLVSEAFKEMADIEDKAPRKGPNKNLEYKNRIKTLIAQTDYEYIPEAKISFAMNNIPLEANFGRIIRHDTTDLLINFGTVYGNALEVLKKREFEIITITPSLTPIEVAKTLFSGLGYQTWINPSFYTGDKVEVIPGLHAAKDEQRLFIPEKTMTITAANYLKKEAIKVLYTSTPRYLHEKGNQ